MLGSFRTAVIPAAVLSALPVLAQNGNDAADDAVLDRTPQDCIIASRIDRTEVVDDNTIIFHMRGQGEAYANYLPQRCPNLGREKRFTYERRTAQLCDDTTITVLELTGFGPGFTCRLGEFHPVTQAEVAEIKRVAEQRGRGDAVDVEEVELPDEADDDSGRDDEAEGDGDEER
ncbi:MAG TPA: hypothetical protein VF339_04615 [Gammaproteobacteria bacterium]